MQILLLESVVAHKLLSGRLSLVQVDVDKPLGLQLEASKSKGGGLRVKVSM